MVKFWYLLMLIIYSKGNRVGRPRVITDLEVIYGSHGVPVMYWYNETITSRTNNFASAAGCPKSIDGIPWIYYKKPNRCFLAGTHGPCSIGDRLLMRKGSSYGICACECLAYGRHPGALLGRERYVGCMREATDIVETQYQIFDKVKEKCYVKWQRGPCPKRDTVITDFNSTSLECLPICRFPVSRLEQQRLQCRMPWLVLSAVNGVQPSQCKEKHEVYSPTLKKCVKQFSRTRIQIG